MIEKKVQDAINAQINKELFSEYLYLAMASYFQSIDLLGFSKWMTVQAAEERAYAMKFVAHLFDRGGKVIYDKLEKPVEEWKSPLDAFEAAYKHELFITKSIYEVIEIAQKNKDYAALEMLQWFVKEQVEEEANPLYIVSKLKMIDSSASGILFLDSELGKRG